MMEIGDGGQPAKAAPPPQLPVPPPKPPRDLEAVIGTNWLSKLGVLMLLIGTALFLGFSLTEMSHPRRIGTGVATVPALLAAGVTFMGLFALPRADQAIFMSAARSFF